jgi:hypothetical protein
LREEDMHAFEDDGTDSECMDVEDGFRYSEGSTIAVRPSPYPLVLQMLNLAY